MRASHSSMIGDPIFCVDRLSFYLSVRQAVVSRLASSEYMRSGFVSSMIAGRATVTTVSVYQSFNGN